jgi:hypothetical protein
MFGKSEFIEIPNHVINGGTGSMPDENSHLGKNSALI